MLFCVCVCVYVRVWVCDLVSAPFHLSSLTFGCSPPLSDHHLRKAHFFPSEIPLTFCVGAGGGWGGGWGHCWYFLWRGGEIHRCERAHLFLAMLPLCVFCPSEILCMSQRACVCVFDQWSNYGYVLCTNPHTLSLNMDFIWAVRAPLMPCLLKIAPFFAAASHAAGYI